jgi:hypothetical protein
MWWLLAILLCGGSNTFGDDAHGVDPKQAELDKLISRLPQDLRAELQKRIALQAEMRKFVEAERMVTAKLEPGKPLPSPEEWMFSLGFQTDWLYRRLEPRLVVQSQLPTGLQGLEIFDIFNDVKKGDYRTKVHGGAAFLGQDEGEYPSSWIDRTYLGFSLKDKRNQETGKYEFEGNLEVFVSAYGSQVTTLLPALPPLNELKKHFDTDKIEAKSIAKAIGKAAAEMGGNLSAPLATLHLVRPDPQEYDPEILKRFRIYRFDLPVSFSYQEDGQPAMVEFLLFLSIDPDYGTRRAYLLEPRLLANELTVLRPTHYAPENASEASARLRVTPLAWAAIWTGRRAIQCHEVVFDVTESTFMRRVAKSISGTDPFGNPVPTIYDDPEFGKSDCIDIRGAVHRSLFLPIRPEVDLITSGDPYRWSIDLSGAAAREAAAPALEKTGLGLQNDGTQKTGPMNALQLFMSDRLFVPAIHGKKIFLPDYQAAEKVIQAFGDRLDAMRSLGK